MGRKPICCLRQTEELLAQFPGAFNILKFVYLSFNIKWSSWCCCNYFLLHFPSWYLRRMFSCKCLFISLSSKMQVWQIVSESINYAYINCLTHVNLMNYLDLVWLFTWKWGLVIYFLCLLNEDLHMISCKFKRKISNSYINMVKHG